MNLLRSKYNDGKFVAIIDSITDAPEAVPDLTARGQPLVASYLPHSGYPRSRVEG